jgi:HK97 gp10 family phage protein
MMAKRETFKVEGLAELARALRELPEKVAKNGLRVSVYAGAKVVRDEARIRAPRAAQSLGANQPPPGTLRRSVIMKQIPELSSLTRQTFFVTVRHGKKYRKQGKKGNLSQDAWYWRFVEFGTRKMRARPFLRPALEAKRREAVQAMKDRLSERIELEAKNLFRGQQRK